MMVNNADWLLNLNYVELLREVGACFSVNNMLRAECYKQRMEKGLSFLEFNYMIMQSYDFYYLFQHYGCNMQFGGDDQWSNMLGGTELIRRKLGKDAHAMTITLLLNSEGKKMGKTASGAVWLDPNKTTPYDFYQYWRNVGDADVLKCIRMLTFLPLEQIDEMDTLGGQPAQPGQGDPGLRADQAGPRRGGGRKGPELLPRPSSCGGGDSEQYAHHRAAAEAQLTDGKIGILNLLAGLRPGALQRARPGSLVQQGGVFGQTMRRCRISSFAVTGGACCTPGRQDSQGQEGFPQGGAGLMPVSLSLQRKPKFDENARPSAERADGLTVF